MEYVCQNLLCSSLGEYSVSCGRVSMA